MVKYRRKVFLTGGGRPMRGEKDMRREGNRGLNMVGKDRTLV